MRVGEAWLVALASSCSDLSDSIHGTPRRKQRSLKAVFNVALEELRVPGGTDWWAYSDWEKSAEAGNEFAEWMADRCGHQHLAPPYFHSWLETFVLKAKTLVKRGVLDSGLDARWWDVIGNTQGMMFSKSVGFDPATCV